MSTRLLALPTRGLARANRSRVGRTTVALLAALLVMVSFDGISAHAASTSTARSSPASLADPFMGTGSGGASVGEIHTSPAAAVTFGMMQWGPDTAPVRSSGGGDSAGQPLISGFSLTHL